MPVHGGLLLLGLALLLVGLGFKVAAVPFHSWSPDVYDGAPTPSVAFMAGAVKAAAFAALIRVFVLTFPNYVTDWRPIVFALAVLSMVVGSVLAIVQTNVKRMLAYSSINHAGFILLAVAASSSQGTAALLFYLAAYTFMVAGSFGVVSLVSGRGDARTRSPTTGACRSRTRCWPAASSCSCWPRPACRSPAGSSPSSRSSRRSSQAKIYWLALVAMVSAVIAASLYLRVIVAMYMTGDAHGEDEAPGHPPHPGGDRGPHRHRPVRPGDPRHRHLPADRGRRWPSTARRS